ncbi:MAG: DUF3619 family protein [Zoogloeaceae bacterium]|jgi:hypothetical protein|nr:DUF3619 family protein [Zoogloeaceae bacterium]
MNRISDEADEVEFAARIRGMLDHGTAGLSQKITLKLYEARCAALRPQPAPVAVFSYAGLGQLAGNSWHRHYRGILAFLGLMIGVFGVQTWQNFQQANELAAIDSELLSDELPPSAYTDPRFLRWLQHLSESDNDSLS